MESSEFYSELRAKGLLLANHDGKLRVWPKEKQSCWKLYFQLVFGTALLLGGFAFTTRSSR